MQIVTRKLSEIHPYEKNPRKNAQAVEAVAESIRQCGYIAPIIVDEDGVILAGHTRYKALQKLGRDEAQVVVKEGLTEEQKRKYRLLDNKTGELAEWDFDLLADELDGLDFGDFDFGWETEKDSKEVKEDDFLAHLPVNPKTKQGQIYMLGRHRLMIGDSTNHRDMETLTGGSLADLIVTDPPYGVDMDSNKYGSRGKKRIQRTSIKNDNLPESEFIEFLKKAFANMIFASKKGAPFYIWYAGLKHSSFDFALREVQGIHVSEQLIWKKTSPVMGRADYLWNHECCLYGWKEGAPHYFVDERSNKTVIEDQTSIKIDKMTKGEMQALLHEILDSKRETSVIEEPKNQSSDLHPTMKPVRLMGRLIINSSKSGDIVLDPFAGSGSTLIACEQIGRKCYCMEIDPKYADVIIDRWEKFTGEKAVLIK